MAPRFIQRMYSHSSSPASSSPASGRHSPYSPGGSGGSGVGHYNNRPSSSPDYDHDKIFPRTQSVSSDNYSERMYGDFKMSPSSSISSVDSMRLSVSSSLQQDNPKRTSISECNDYKHQTISEVLHRTYNGQLPARYADIQPFPVPASLNNTYPYTVFNHRPFQNISVFTIDTKTCKGSSSKNARGKLVSNEPVPCALCKRKIENKHLLHALDKYWHEKCLKCDFCRKPLYKFGTRFYYRQGAKFCHEDFMRTFGGRGACSMCEEIIPPTDYVLRFNGNLVYHLDCFKCCNCKKRFCVGDPVNIANSKNLFCNVCKTTTPSI